MKNIIQILTVIILLPWPLAMMTAPMMFGAPGATDDKGNLLLVMAVSLYPAIIFGIYWLLGQSFFSFSSMKLFIFSAILGMAIVTFIDIPKYLYNISQGISNSGYFKTKDAVYLHGDKLSSDPDNFEELGQFYSRDSVHVYYFNEIVKDADPKKFEIKK